MKGTRGLVTALHGVLDCEHIKAWTDETNPPISGLHIVYVDIARDLAILGAPGEGGLIRRMAPVRKEEEFLVFGYPLNVATRQDAHVRVRREGPTKKLRARS